MNAWSPIETNGQRGTERIGEPKRGLNANELIKVNISNVRTAFAACANALMRTRVPNPWEKGTATFLLIKWKKHLHGRSRLRRISRLVHRVPVSPVISSFYFLYFFLVLFCVHWPLEFVGRVKSENFRLHARYSREILSFIVSFIVR